MLKLPVGGFAWPTDDNWFGGSLNPNQLDHFLKLRAFVQLRETYINSGLKGLFIVSFISCLKRDIVPARTKGLGVCLHHMHIAIMCSL